MSLFSYICSIPIPLFPFSSSPMIFFRYLSLAFSSLYISSPFFIVLILFLSLCLPFISLSLPIAFSLFLPFALSLFSFLLITLSLSPLFLSSILLSIHSPSLYYPLLILLPLLVLHFLSPSTHFHLHITLSFSSATFPPLFTPPLPPSIPTPTPIPYSQEPPPPPPPVTRAEGGGVPRHFPEGAAMSHTLSPITSYSPKEARGRGRSKEVDYC